MTILIAALAGMMMQAAAPATGWTWTLYEGEGPLVLANEVPDTPDLRSTLECQPGSGVARVSLYGASLGSGVARASSGERSATTEADGSRRDKTSMSLRTDHPVFTQFIANGALAVSVADRSQTLTIERPHLPKLRRFAELCGG